MRIIGIDATNVGRLKTVNVRFGDNKIFKVGGRNAQGKTTLTNLLAMALSGKKAWPSVPVRKGEKSAELVLHTESLVIKQNVSAKTGRLTMTVTDTEGRKQPDQAALLKTLFSERLTDLSKLLQMKEKDLGILIEKIAGLDLGKLREHESAAFDDRKNRSAQKKQAEAALNGMPDLTVSASEVPEKALDSRELANELVRMGGEIRDQNAKEEALAILRKAVVAKKESIKKLQEELIRDVDDGKKLAAEVAGFAKPDLSVVESQLEKVNEINKDVALRDRHNEAADTVAAMTARLDESNANLAGVRKQITDAIGAANYPVQGLDVREGVPFYNDLPLSDASDSQKMLVCAEIGLAENPEVKALLVTKGSLLDDDALMALEMALEKHEDAFAIVEVVAKPGSEVANGCQIVIEDGEVIGGES